MATRFNTQVGNGEYRLQFETNNEAHYLLMQSAARRCIDHAHMTNADKICSMTDDELNDLFIEIYDAGVEDASSYEWGNRKNSFEWSLKWLMQPVEEVNDAESVD